MIAMRARAGTSADGASPNAAIPAGRDKTPTPTMALTRLKISDATVAVPLPTATTGALPLAPCALRGDLGRVLGGALALDPPRSVTMGWATSGDPVSVWDEVTMCRGDRGVLVPVNGNGNCREERDCTSMRLDATAVKLVQRLSTFI